MKLKESSSSNAKNEKPALNLRGGNFRFNQHPFENCGDEIHIAEMGSITEEGRLP